MTRVAWRAVTILLSFLPFCEAAPSARTEERPIGVTFHQDDYHRWMHERTGSLGFWYSENPYGPWKQFFYTDNWTADDPQNLVYQPTLSPKWISNDGKEMTLIWSDAMKNKDGKSRTVNYRWNQMRVTIRTE